MKKFFPKILLAVIGAALILYGTVTPLLGVVGERTTGEITVVRRSGGERDETIRNRYNYSVGYEFTLPDGMVVYGSTTVIGSSYSAGVSLGPAAVRYWKAWPRINALEADTAFTFGTVVLIAAGALLLVVALRGNRGRRQSKKSVGLL